MVQLRMLTPPMTWVVDKDSVIVSAYAVASAGAPAFLLTSDPVLASTDLINPASSSVVYEFALFLRGSGGGSSQPLILENLNIPISAGSTLYLSGSSPGTLFIQLEDVIAI